MLPIKFSLNIDASRFGELSKRALNRQLKRAFQAMGERWAEKYLPKHFNTNAVQRYGYERRSSWYNRRKRRLAGAGIVEDGGRRPLVFSGNLRRVALTVPSVRGYPSRVVVKVQTPSYVPLRPRRANMPNMAEELTKLKPDERNDLLKLFNDVLENGLEKELENAAKRSRRRR